MGSSVNLTKRVRNRKLRSGAIVAQTRWVLNYREPTGRRRQMFFERQKDAQAKRNQIIAEVETGTYSEAQVRTVTIRNCVERWLEARDGQVKAGTLVGYRRAKMFLASVLALPSHIRATLRHEISTSRRSLSWPMYIAKVRTVRALQTLARVWLTGRWTTAPPPGSSRNPATSAPA